jgi:dTDP-4-amino-4,6-dideoxygalactose transaminase
MSMSKIALLGGAPTIPAPLPPYRSLGDAERRAVVKVIDSGVLSGFYGSPGDEFYGGLKVREFEAMWRESCGSRHAISVNSATSGLIAAMGAIGIGPGDEVIVPATTMSATAVACLFYGGIPVFADIEDETFCINLASVEAAIGPRTRAIIAVNLFGHPARLAELRKLADDRGIYLVEDAAQSPLSFEAGRRAGTIGHIGVFSLNYHKHIHTGEGGFCVTDDDVLAKRLSLIRNHAENSAEWLGIDDATNMVGMNLRMTELGAAVGIEQLRQAETHIGARERVAQALSAAVDGLEGLKAPQVRDGCRHNYYCWVMRYDEKATGVARKTFSAALAAEGFPHFVGYVEPLYRLPLFRKRHAIGREGFPFTLSNRRYWDGMCPVAERLHAADLVLFEPCAWAVDDTTLDLLGQALRRVHDNLPALRELERRQAAE